MNITVIRVFDDNYRRLQRRPLTGLGVMNLVPERQHPRHSMRQQVNGQYVEVDKSMGNPGEGRRHCIDECRVCDR